MKFTKGPWIFDSGCFYSPVQMDETGMTSELPIAEMLGGREEDYEANARLIAAAPELLEALIAITSNSHINLGDLVYEVREREGEGWEGTAVKQWSEAVSKVESAIAKATGGGDE
jgi:hypothetical protein